MNKREIVPVLTLFALLLVVAGFFGGMWIQDLRSGRPDSAELPAHPPEDVAVRPIPDLETSGRVVAGFENQEALLLGVNGLLRYDPQALVRIVAAVGDRIRIIGVVANAGQNAEAIALLKSNHLPETSIGFF